MKTTSYLLLLFFLISFSQTGISQEEDIDRVYAIQVATYGSYDAFVKNKDHYTPYSALYTQKVGKTIKVFLLRHYSQFNSDELFYPGSDSDEMFTNIKANFPGAFKKKYVDVDNLTSGWDIIRKYSDKDSTPKNDDPVADDKRYVIQIATFGSYADFVKEKNKYAPYETLYTQQVGKQVKVYLLARYEEGAGLFYAGDLLDNGVRNAKISHPGAFRKSGVAQSDLTPGWKVFENYSNNKVLPAEYASKGGKSIATKDKSAYKIQLGVFKQQQSMDHIANNYGLTNSDKAQANTLISHDFKKIKKDICRRYFYGDFDSKSAALTKKKALEKESKRKLILVKTKV